MRIYGPSSAGKAATAAPTRRAGSSTFSVGGEEAARPTTAAAPPRGVGGIDALLALQGLDEAGERRRRGVRRGRSALDALDSLKLGLLGGTLDTAALAKLVAATTVLSERTGDPGLDEVLAEIELRAQVELAKLGPTAAPPG